jgi:transposase
MRRPTLHAVPCAAWGCKRLTSSESGSMEGGSAHDGYYHRTPSLWDDERRIGSRRPLHPYLCLIDTHSGEEIIEEGRIRPTPETLKRRFASEKSIDEIAIEVGTHSPWVGRLLQEECGHEILVADARKVRPIYAKGRKNDEPDAKNLARLARLDPELLYLLEHRGRKSCAHLALIRSRAALVGSRTQLINQVRGTAKSFGYRLPKCSAPSFHDKVASHLPEELVPALGLVLQTIARSTRRIREYEREMEGIETPSITRIRRGLCAR